MEGQHNLNLSQMQFEHYLAGAQGYHHIDAVLPGESGYEKDKLLLGSIRWAPASGRGVRSPGEIVHLRVQPEVRREGIATGLWNEAHKYDPPPRHSSKRTPRGTAWAKSTGAKVPKLTRPLPDEDDDQ